MGNWNINIQGIGCHHNGLPASDADLLAAEFVAKLKEKGHTIESASFTSGGKTDLVELAKPVARVSVIVNGKRVETDNPVTYDALRSLAEQGPQPSVTYRKARFGKEGILQPGCWVDAVSGETIFSVADTGNA